MAAEGQPASTAAAAAAAASRPLLLLNSAPAPRQPLPTDRSLSSLSPAHSRHHAMPAIAPAAAAAAPAAAAPCWADLPPALWEAIADRLPAPDIMALRQAWRGTSQLGHPRLCSEACSALEEEMWPLVTRAVAGAFMTATEGMVAMAEMVGEVDTRFLYLFMERVAGALGREGRFQLVQHSEYLEDRPGQRRTYELEAPQAGVVMQASSTNAGSWPACGCCACVAAAAPAACGSQHACACSPLHPTHTALLHDCWHSCLPRCSPLPRRRS